MADDSMKDWTITRFLEAVASQAPVPGGGAAAALAGAAAAALLRMVLSLAQRRAKDPAAHPTLDSLLDRAQRLQQQFADLADADVAAYRGVANALALPRSTDEERARRAAVLQQALSRAAEVPLDTARVAVEALALGAEAGPLCPRVAQSDLVTALHLLRAACAAALANVDANALSLDPSPFRSELARSRAALSSAAQARSEGILASLDGALGRWRGPPGAATT